MIFHLLNIISMAIKKGIVVSVFFLLLINSFASAQDERKNLIKLNLLGPVTNYFSAFYERELNQNASLQVGAGYINNLLLTESNWWDNTRRKNSVNGYFAIIEYRFYLSEKTFPKGFFIAPFMRYQYMTLTHEESSPGNMTETSKRSFNLINGGLVVGGQWVFKQKISLDIWVGPEIHSRSEFIIEDSNGSQITKVAHFGVLPRLGVTLGWLF